VGQRKRSFGFVRIESNKKKDPYEAEGSKPIVESYQKKSIGKSSEKERAKARKNKKEGKATPGIFSRKKRMKCEAGVRWRGGGAARGMI